MPLELALSIVVPIFNGKGDIRNCNCYRDMKLLQHEMKVVESMLEKKLCRIVNIYKIKFGFMPERRTNDAVFMLGRKQKEYHAKGKK